MAVSYENSRTIYDGIRAAAVRSDSPLAGQPGTFDPPFAAPPEIVGGSGSSPRVLAFLDT